MLAHNLLFGAIVTAIAARWIGFRAGPLALVFAAFVSHLVGDYFGSGPGWGISPYLPFSSHEYLFDGAWELVSWQNTTIGAAFIVLTLVIAARRGYTPLETLLPSVDRAVVQAIRLRVTATPCATCGARAWFHCGSCAQPLCGAHARAVSRVARRCGTCITQPAT